MKKLLVIAIFSSTLGIAQNTWMTKISLLGIARHGSTAFSIGTKGYVFGGTAYPADTILKDLWEWNQSNGAWTQKATIPLAQPRFAGAGFSIGTKGYVCGGEDTTSYFSQLYEYNQANNTWYTKTAFPGGGRAWAVSFSIGTQGYFCSGMGAGGYCADLWEWDQATNTWTQKANLPGHARASAVGFSIGGKGYVGTGQSALGEESDFWEWDQASNTWTQRADFGGGARSAAVGFSVGGAGFIGTGLTAHYGYCKDFWEYNPAADVWVQRANFSGAGRMYAIGYGIGAKGYIGTGFSGTSFTSVKDYYEYTPNPAGMDETDQQVQVSVGPNPFTTQAAFTFGKPLSNAGISIMDISGKVVRVEHFSGDKMVLGRSGLPPGVYFYQVVAEGALVAAGKLVAE
jgi:hypothetical protein